MNIQKSFEKDNGKLYLVATPIGNLGDITFRAIETLKAVDYIACEDTRVTIKLLNYYEIKKPLISYHEHNKFEAGISIVERIEMGANVALVTDAGTPCISDPGYEIVCLAIENNIDVVPIPGANAAITSLIISGILPQPFTFFGFLDHKKQIRRNQIDELKYFPYTMIFYESPHRFKETVGLMSEIFGERNCAIVREVSKKFEEVYRGLVNDVNSYYEEIKGEIVIIVEGNSHPQTPNNELLELDIIEHVNYYMEIGLTKNEAIKKVAIERGVAKRDIYNTFHQQEQEQ
ncbi:MAG: rRNA methyltransferase [Haloplasmataceae bacterium]|jgi:16S rRNA (cytidine1402-2'-O)-methyltransferase|nr:rRNA methyltransferase [Haloplasmataceae bacterium]